MGLFDELVQGVEAILAAGHMGVIIHLAESCAESEEKQDELLQCLLRVSAKDCLLNQYNDTLVPGYSSFTPEIEHFKTTSCLICGLMETLLMC